MSSGVSEQEIERELQTLRNLRRRSASSPGPGALAVDPDLPPPSPGSQSSTSPTYTSNDDITLSTPDGLDDGGLFWVPAHLHPELAPGEFRNFLKQHTHADPEHASANDAGDAEGLQRSSSWLARSNSRKESLGRKRSMLSKQYHPRAGDNVEEDRPPMPLGPRSSIYGGKAGDKGLTLQDLQQLEAIVDQADEEGDPDAARAMLRRTLSTNRSPGFLHEGEEGSESGLGRPQSILRRSARTRIRKANLPGDGGGHRFASTRKGRRTAAPDIDIPEDDWDGRKYSTGTSDESAEYDSQDHATRETGILVDEDGNRFYDAPQHLEERRGSDSTDDMAIFDAYRQSRSSSASSENSYEDSPSNESSPPEKTISLPQIPNIVHPDASDWFAEEGEKTPTQERAADPFGGMRRTESGPGLSLQLPPDTPQTPMAARSPTSPTTPQARPMTLPSSDLPPGMAAPRQSLKAQGSREDLGMIPVNLETPRPALARVDSRANQEKEREKEKEKEKEKKGGFFSKKDKTKEKDKSKKEKDGLFGSLFGGKKKQEEVPTVTNFSSTDGRAAAAALLGTSKSAKSLGLHGLPTPGVSPTSPGFPNNYARYPIHVERAIYRLSHIKLANARRPLFEQVLISNLMFWYLGIIGRNVAEEKKPSSTNGKDGKEGKEGGEDKEQKVIIKGTPIKPADSGSAGTPLPRPPPQQPNKERKMGLSKPGRSRSGRDHEAPIKAPSYGSQNAQVDHEVRTATAQVQGMSMKSRPTQNTPPPREYHPPAQQYQPAPQQYQTPPQQQQQPSPHDRQVSPQPPHMQGAPQQNRSASPPGPQRALSPPASTHSRPTSEIYPANPHAPGHPATSPVMFQAPPRGVPQSSFGPPPPVVNGHGPAPMSGPGPAPPFDDRRQRTMSQPGHAPPAQQGPPAPNMRRVVTDGRPPPGHNPYADGGRVQEHRLPQHGGPQPGQLFQYPGGATSPPPQGGPPPPGSPFTQRPQQGQPHSPVPGQVFHHQQPPHQQYSPHLQHQRPLPDSGGPPPGWQQGGQRLLPGAQQPQFAHPDAHLQRQLSQPPQNRPPQPYPPQQFQQHPQHGMPPNRPPPQQYYQQGPPQQRPPPQQQHPGQPYSPQPGYGPPPDGVRRAPAPVYNPHQR